MKILIRTPYLDILGGGEQYLLNFADCMSAHHQVTFVWKNSTALKKAAKRFSIPTKKFQTIPFIPPKNRLKEYDLLFFVSDGSIPFLPQKKSILLFMSPFKNPPLKAFPNKIKLKFINHVLCFSQYTKKFIDKEFSISSQMIYPAVKIPQSNIPKENIILSVGRFSQTLHQKNQSSMIKTFVDLESKLPGWKLILAGGTETGSRALLKKLKQSSKNHHISIKTNISSSSLIKLYSQAKIYWHAAGYNEDLQKFPQKAEHFGISIVEAMGQGTVPLVFNAGGPKEIITEKSGRTWSSPAQLKQYTLELAENSTQLKTLSTGARQRAKFFSKKKFCRQFYELVEK